MIVQTFEGIWEEVARHSDELKGRRVRVTVFEDDAFPQTNKQALEVIERISQKQKKMHETSDAETLQILRDGRSGEMFGYDTDK